MREELRITKNDEFEGVASIGGDPSEVQRLYLWVHCTVSVQWKKYCNAICLMSISISKIRIQNAQ